METTITEEATTTTKENVPTTTITTSATIKETTTLPRVGQKMEESDIILINIAGHMEHADTAVQNATFPIPIIKKMQLSAT